ncbi:MAG: hypothetical protein WC554_10960 [Clostridia bacterium]
MKAIRNFIYSVKNIIKWIPVLWKDREWDYMFLYEIVYQKIHNMRKYHEKANFFVGVENEIKWMKVCEKLLRILIDSTYWEDEYDNKPLNIRKMNLTDVYLKLYEKNNGRTDIREEKAKRLLFKILSWRVEYWWD